MAKKEKRKTARKVVAKRTKGPVKKAKRAVSKKASARKMAKRASPAKKASPARALVKSTRKAKMRVPPATFEQLVHSGKPQFVAPLDEV
jgi:hypothetical protein